MNDMELYDNYEEDGQLSLFGVEEASENEAPVLEAMESAIRIGRCGSCGKLLFVREEKGGYRSECNNCGVKYFQKS